MGIPRAENGALSDREVKGNAEHERDRKKVSRSDDDDDQSDSNTLQYALRALVRGTTFLLGARALLAFGAGAASGSRGLQRAVQSYFSKDTLQQSSFFGVYAFLYVLLRNKFSKIVDEEKNKNPFVSKYFLAGTCAGISIVLDDRERANALAKYTMSRATALLLQSGTSRKLLPYVPHLGAIVFILAEIPIMCGFLLEPECVDPSYYRLILKWSRDVTDVKLGKVFRNCQYTEHFPSCEEIGYHKGMCATYLLHDLVQNWLITAKMYTPIYCIPRLTLSLKRTLKNPVESVKKTAIDIFKSGMMLAQYIFMMKMTLCTYRNVSQMRAGSIPASVMALGGVLTGTGVFWESRSRSEELAIYVAPQALTIIWNVLRKRGWVTDIWGANVLMFSLSMGVMMHNLEKKRHLLKPYIRYPLEKVVFGPFWGMTRRARLEANRLNAANDKDV